MRAKVRYAAAVLMMLGVSGAMAHHSGAMFDRAKVVTLRGTVKDFLFSNPHSWIRLLVPDGHGVVMEWDIEGAATARMTAWRITPRTVRAGDVVSLRMHPLRDGRRGGSLIDVTLANGEVLSTASDTQTHSQ